MRLVSLESDLPQYSPHHLMAAVKMFQTAVCMTGSIPTSNRASKDRLVTCRREMRNAKMKPLSLGQLQL